jgi:hypothetical protein
LPPIPEPAAAMIFGRKSLGLNEIMLNAALFHTELD